MNNWAQINLVIGHYLCDEEHASEVVLKDLLGDTYFCSFIHSLAHYADRSISTLIDRTNGNCVGLLRVSTNGTVDIYDCNGYTVLSDAVSEKGYADTN